MVIRFPSGHLLKLNIRDSLSLCKAYSNCYSINDSIDYSKLDRFGYHPLPMRSWTVPKLQVIALLVDRHWTTGVGFRAKQVERELYRERDIELAEKTIHNILDSLVDDQILAKSTIGREKLYSVNEQLRPEALRIQFVRILGIEGWVRPQLLHELRARK